MNCVNVVHTLEMHRDRNHFGELCCASGCLSDLHRMITEKHWVREIDATRLMGFA